MKGIWRTAFGFLLNFALAYALAALLPRPKTKDREPTIDNITFPTATEDRVVPVVWGKVRIYPNCIWIGDFKAVEQKKKMPADMWGLIKDEVRIGWHYYAGLQLVLSVDALDTIEEVWVDKRKVWEGSVQVIPGMERSFVIDSSWDEPGEEVKNGLFAIVDVHSNPAGIPDEYLSFLSTSEYLAEQIGEENLPAYTGTTYIVWRGPSAERTYQTIDGFGGQQITVERLSGWFGSRQTFPRMGFVVTRQPKLDNFFDGGEFYGFTGPTAAIDFIQFVAQTSTFENEGANPAWVLAEILTNRVWGAGLRGRMLDQSSFCAAAERLHSEGIGFSYAWETPAPISELVEMIERHTNGVLRRDPRTGRLTFKLAREDDEPVLALSPSNITEMRSIFRTAVDQAINEVRVPYIDRDATYTERFGVARDPAGIEAAGGRVISTEVRFEGVHTADDAAYYAMRELRAQASSLTKASLTAAISPGTLVHIGDVVTLDWPPLGIESMRLRVQRAEYSDALTSVRLELVQDVFRPGSTFFSVPSSGVGSGGGGPGSGDPVDPVMDHDLGWLTAPYALTGDEGTHLVIYATVPRPPYINDPPEGYQLEWSHDVIDTVSSIERGPRNFIEFAVSGELADDVLPAATSVLIRVRPSDAEYLAATARTDFFVVFEGGEEWALSASYTIVSTSEDYAVVRLDGLERGLFHTLPHSFVAPESSGSFRGVLLLFDYEVDPNRLMTDLFIDGVVGTRLPGAPAVKFRAIGKTADGREAPRGTDVGFIYDEAGVELGLPWTFYFQDTTSPASFDPVGLMPLPPADVRLNGVLTELGMSMDPEATVGQVSGSSLTLSWRPRNRTLRSTKSWYSSGDGSLESGTEIEYRVRRYRAGGSYATLAEGQTAWSSSVSISIPVEEDEEGNPVEDENGNPVSVVQDGDFIEVYVSAVRSFGPYKLRSQTFHGFWKYAD